jgi:hypothetical protein
MSARLTPAGVDAWGAWVGSAMEMLQREKEVKGTNPQFYWG